MLDLFNRLRRTKVLKVLLGGSAIGLAAGGAALAQEGVVADSGEDSEGQDVALDLEDGVIEVAVGSDDDPLGPGDSGVLGDSVDSADVDSPAEDEDGEVSAQDETPETSPSPESVDSPPDPETPPSPQSVESPETPPSPESADTPESPESPDTPESPDEDED